MAHVFTSPAFKKPEPKPAKKPVPKSSPIKLRKSDQRYTASIRLVTGLCVHLGDFRTERQAQEAYDLAFMALYGGCTKGISGQAKPIYYPASHYHAEQIADMADFLDRRISALTQEHTNYEKF